jgi:hypothetical protein
MGFKGKLPKPTDYTPSSQETDDPEVFLRSVAKLPDQDYYLTLCFENGDQKLAFLKALGIEDYGDKFLDGRLFARKYGIKIPRRK